VATTSAQYPAPAVGLPPWYRFAINGLVLRYIAGGDGRATALRASQRHNQAMSHTSAIVEPSQLSPAVTL